MEDTHMRLAGIEKGGFHPYPPRMAEACKRSGASWFIPLPAGRRGRLLDPCAGEGEIASLLGKLLKCETLRAEPHGKVWGWEGKSSEVFRNPPSSEPG